MTIRTLFASAMIAVATVLLFADRSQGQPTQKLDYYCVVLQQGGSSCGFYSARYACSGAAEDDDCDYCNGTNWIQKACHPHAGDICTTTGSTTQCGALVTGGKCKKVPTHDPEVPFELVCQGGNAGAACMLDNC